MSRALAVRAVDSSIGGESNVEDHPYYKVVEALRQRGIQVRRTGRTDQVRACCPAHNDRRPSLVVTRSYKGVGIKCFHGCHWRNIATALGLRPSDLFSSRTSTTPVLRNEVAVYPYCDESGRLVAEKVRTEPKGFYFRVPGLARGGGLHGAQLGLYRAERVRAEGTVFVAEGEKAVEKLAAIGIPAVCPPYGASSWRDAFTAQLFKVPRQLVVILADADKAGRSHALRVAQACYEHNVFGEMAATTIKLVELEGLPPGGDVVDWLDGGHTADDLQAQVDGTPAWTPTLSAEQKRIRVRAQTRERARRFRERQRRRAGEAKG